ncbi:bifunctional riboflavin kinase/FAD synthetase [Buchnera aphidicola]|uniref:Riboflavin biosynthesis protein n=1 Tax=Buchnera aphidicola subsp. Melaphis rhois TaxID=118103 RepID=A0A4D6Y2A0_BUCMH|nr:bifunctional riboflavin kinase/FAD synthetase [Buchnera aphidicola]QCI23177.1 bifunctional riboflavin kinase/FAD synthetase [Buchnera aphidicola (Melaphis rhois)]
MKLIRNINNLKFQTNSCILTIGNFDGVHLGHQKLLNIVCKKKKEHNKPIIVTIFEPYPLEFFCSENPPVRLMNFREKIQYLSQWNIDAILCIYFNKSFSSLSPMNFITNIMVKKLNVFFLAVGKNFCFGSNRQGNTILLKSIGKHYKFSVHTTKILKINEIEVSSTAIRQALKNNNLKLAKMLLGRSFSMSGKVTYGKKNGTKIGFPTANIELNKNNSPIYGVFIVKVFILSLKRMFFGVANIGTQPTMNGKTQKLEVHLIDSSLNLYKQYIKVIFIKKIRDEIFFTSIKNLKEQIMCDISKARLHFNNQIHKKL